MDETTTEEHLRSPLLPRWFWVMVVIIALLCWRGPEIVQAWSGQQAADGVGTFGDQFGAINTLFSGLAFLGVLAGLWIQGREFRHQLKEMQVNAVEMKAQSAIYGEQLKMLQRQNEMLDRQNALMGHQLVNAQVQERLAAQPFLTLTTDMDDSGVDIDVKNEGATVYGLEVTAVEGYEEDRATVGLLTQGSSHCCFVLLDQEKATRRVELHVRYVTRMGMDATEVFVVPRRIARSLEQGQTAQTDMMSIGRRIREEVERLHLRNEAERGNRGC